MRACPVGKQFKLYTCRVTISYLQPICNKIEFIKKLPSEVVIIMFLTVHPTKNTTFLFKENFQFTWISNYWSTSNLFWTCKPWLLSHLKPNISSLSLAINWTLLSTELWGTILRKKQIWEHSLVTNNKWKIKCFYL